MPVVKSAAATARWDDDTRVIRKYLEGSKGGFRRVDLMVIKHFAPYFRWCIGEQSSNSEASLWGLETREEMEFCGYSVPSSCNHEPNDAGDCSDCNCPANPHNLMCPRSYVCAAC